jgi:hypothetical protein
MEEAGPDMIFTKRLRPGVQSGAITCSVRIWMQPRVKVGHRYALGDGQIEVDSILPITLQDITPELALAKHGRGENVYLVRFHYVPGGEPLVERRKAPARRSAAGKKKA